MLLELPGLAVGFDDLPPGGFFMIPGATPEFGLCVSFDGTRSAIMFSYSERHDSPLWLSIGGFLEPAVISLPTAVVRSNLSSASVFIGRPDIGGIISADGEVYIRARESRTNS